MVPIARVYNVGISPKVEKLKDFMFSQESDAHQFIISAVSDGEDVAFDGTATAYFMRGGGPTLTVEATVAAGKIYATLNQDCYKVPGPFTFTVFNEAGGGTCCVYACVGEVYRTRQEPIIDSGEVVPSLNDVTAVYDQLVELKDEATTALDDLEFATGIEVKTGWVQNYSYNIPSTVSSIAIDGYTATNNYACIYSACTHGDTFYVTGLGGSGSKLWAWTKADGTIIDRADSNLNATNLKLVAPKEAAYLLVNVDYRNDYSLLKGDTASDAMGLAKNGIAPYNATNLMTIWSKRNVVAGGIAFDWVGPSTCHIHGTSTTAATIEYAIWNTSSGMPPYVESGKRYIIRKSINRKDVLFRMRFYNGQGTFIKETFFENAYKEMDIPGNVANLRISVGVSLGAVGVSIDETVTFEFLSEWPSPIEIKRLSIDNKYNVIAPYIGLYETVSTGCTFAWNDDGECTVSGDIASGNVLSYQSIITRDIPCLPYMMKPGRTFFIEETLRPGLVGLQFYDENVSPIFSTMKTLSTAGDKFTVPANAVSVGLIIGVSSALGYDGTPVTFRPHLFLEKGPIIPPPMSNGTYNLRVTVADGVPTYSWVSV